MGNASEWRLRPKRVPSFQALGIRQGKDFTDWSQEPESEGKSVIAVCEKSQRLADAFCGCEEDEKTFCFVIYSNLKDSAIRAVKRNTKF